MCSENIKIIDIEENADMVEKYAIKSVPTTIIEINGEIVKRQSGNFEGDKKKFEEFITII